MPSGIDRRRSISLLAGAALLPAVGADATAAGPPAGAQAARANVLRVLAWPGYADADIVREFEQRARCEVELTFVATDEQLRAHIDPAGSGGFDVVAANTTEIARWAAAGRLAAIRLERIPRAAQQLPRFRNHAAIPGLRRGPALHALAYTYAEMGLIHDRRLMPQPPVSIAALWDPRWRGRVLAYDGATHNFSLAAQSLGLPPFRIPVADFARVARRLVELRRNVLGFYTLPEESVELFLRHRPALLFAKYGSQQVKLLRDAGADVGYSIPREGALAWLDCWAITAASARLDLAELWIDHMLSIEVGRRLTQRQGLANTLADNAAAPTDGPLVWLEPPEDEARRVELWHRIVSGDRPERLQ